MVNEKGRMVSLEDIKRVIISDIEECESLEEIIRDMAISLVAYFPESPMTVHRIISDIYIKIAEMDELDRKALKDCK